MGALDITHRPSQSKQEQYYERYKNRKHNI